MLCVVTANKVWLDWLYSLTADYNAISTLPRATNIAYYVGSFWVELGSKHRRRSGWTSGGTHGERRSWVHAEWGGICGRVSPLQPTKGSGGASWAPPAESAAEPRPKTDFGVFWRPQNAQFCTYITKSGGTICISVPCSKFWGGLVPLSPVIYAHGSKLRRVMKGWGSSLEGRGSFCGVWMSAVTSPSHNNNNLLYYDADRTLQRTMMTPYNIRHAWQYI